ncbi:hypothetical protein BDZ89DRAFT_1043722 [Hymenopellis radicata]|nr:hypothetical protein BDZ89DRAFT_1043722 [Hymenopellis radicata]
MTSSLSNYYDNSRANNQPSLLQELHSGLPGDPWMPTDSNASMSSQFGNTPSPTWNQAGSEQRHLVNRIHVLEREVQAQAQKMQMQDQQIQAQAREIEMYKQLEVLWKRLSEAASPTVAISAPSANVPGSTSTTSASDLSQPTPPPLFSRQKSSKTKWYMKEAFMTAIKARRTSRHPVNLSAYLEDENGEPIAKSTKADLFATAHVIWNEFHEKNKAPKKLSKATFYQTNYFRSVIGNKFPFLLYAENYWKIDRIWSTQYSSWYNCHVKNIKKQTRAGKGKANKDDDSDEDEDEDDQSDEDDEDDRNINTDADDNDSRPRASATSSKSALKRLPDSTLQNPLLKKIKPTLVRQLFYLGSLCCESSE